MSLSHSYLKIKQLLHLMFSCISGCGPKGGGNVGDQLLALECSENDDVSSIPPVRHMVYAGIFPADQSQHPLLSDAIKKLALNDSAVSVKNDTRCVL